MQLEIGYTLYFKVSFSYTTDTSTVSPFRPVAKELATRNMDHITLCKQKSKNYVMHVAKTLYKISRLEGYRLREKYF